MKLLSSAIVWLFLGLICVPAVSQTQGADLTVVATDAQSQAADLGATSQPTAEIHFKAKEIVFDSPIKLSELTEPRVSLALLGVIQDPIAESDAAYQQRLDGIRNYQLSLELQELEYGAWGQGLAEELISLAALYDLQGNHEEAVVQYERAIHLSRINSGLHSLEQVPAIEKIINSHLKLGQWEEADEKQRYLYYIQNRAYGFTDPRIIPVLDSLAQWNVIAFSRGLGSSPGVRLLDTYNLYSLAARMVDVHFGRKDPRFVAYLENVVSSAYLVWQHRKATKSTSALSVDEAEDLLNTSYESKFRSISVGGFSEGMAALVEISRYYAQKPGAEEEFIQALVQQGDWNLLFERRQSAFKIYRRAWDVVELNQLDPILVTQVFVEPVYLPNFATFTNQLRHSLISSENEGLLRTGYIDVSFDVNPRGRAVKLEILTVDPKENASVAKLLEQRIKSTRFRPKFVDAKPIYSEGVKYRFPYWY